MKRAISISIVAFLICSCSQKEEPTLLPQWTVSEYGFGPVKIGMTVDEAATALGSKLVGRGTPSVCYFVRPENEPAGIMFMVTDGRIARVDVTDSPIPTAAGVRMGDPEGKIEMVYPGSVESQPHKYTDGHYLIVGFQQSGNRIIFETDGTKVTRYRAGKQPEVDWLEGCS